MSFSHKMEILIEDALKVHKLLPWIETEEDIINFMRRIPLDKVHMRNQLALYYFIKENDALNDNEQKIEDEAREIIVLLPDVPYRDIKERLSVLGSTPNRKEIVIRQLLVLRKDLGKIVSEIVNAKKRRTESIFDHLHNNNDETNIKIKIRKIEGALKVVSSIKQEKVSTVPYNSSSEEEDSTSHFSSSSDMSDVGTIQSKLPVRQQPNSNDIRTFNRSSTENNVNPYLPSSSNLNSVNITAKENAIPQFDLVGYLQEVTRVSKKKIISLCRRYEVALSEKPSEDVLLQLLDRLMVPEVIQLDDTSSSGSSCTEEYFNDEMGHVEEPNRSCTAAVKIGESEMFTVQIPPNAVPGMYTPEVKIEDAEPVTVQTPANAMPGLYLPEVKIEDAEPVTVQTPANAMPGLYLPEVKIEDAEPVTVQTPANAVTGMYTSEIVAETPANELPAPVEHVELRTNNVQVVANEPAAATVQAASKFCLRPSSFKIETNKRALIVPPKFIPPSSNKPKSATPDILPAFPQDVWAQINRAIKTLEEERRTFDTENIDNNLLEPSTSKDSEKNKRVEAWLEEVTTSAQPSKRNKRVEPWIEDTSAQPTMRNVEAEETFQAIPSTSTASITQHAPIPSTSKEPDSSTEQTMDAYSKVDENLFLRLIEIFPQACPDYLKSIIRRQSSAEFSSIVSYILSMDNYPKRPERVNSPPADMDFEDQLDMVKALLPDADPQYLHMKCLEFTNNVEGLNQFINDARESGDYPTMKEYLRKQQISAQTKQYTTEFNVENFVELFPDPQSTFNDPNRTITADAFSQGYLINFFLNKYDRLHLKTIRTILLRNNYKILASDKEMSNCMHAKQIMKSRRKPTKLPEPGQNILFLQELAYVEHIDEIEAFIESKKAKTEEERLYAKDNGLMQTCQCCYDDEVMPKDTFECPKGCKFCCDCIKKSCEIAFGEGTIDFKCLTECTEEFTLQTLQNVLPPKMFSKVVQKKALAEVKAAGIEELVTCPFCDFANIPAENDKIFRCLNPECMKESCLKCKEPNHLPLRCDEIEKDNDVKARIFVENQMTEALLRKCWKCGTNFFKEEGCNKMTCTCGAKMCYVCRKPVTDYKHFNGIGGDKFELCPLYTNTNEDNQRAVLQAAEAAKAQIDPANLKVDPSADVKEHYRKRVAALPREPHLDLINYNAGLHRVQLADGNMLQRLQVINDGPQLLPVEPQFLPVEPQFLPVDGDVNRPQIGNDRPQIQPLAMNANHPQIGNNIPQIQQVGMNANHPQNGNDIPQIQQVDRNANRPQIENERPQIQQVGTNANRPQIGNDRPQIQPLARNANRPQIGNNRPQIQQVARNANRPQIGNERPQIQQVARNTNRPQIGNDRPQIQPLARNANRPQIGNDRPQIQPLGRNANRPQIGNDRPQIQPLGRNANRPQVGNDRPQIQPPAKNANRPQIGNDGPRNQPVGRNTNRPQIGSNRSRLNAVKNVSRPPIWK